MHKDDEPFDNDERMEALEELDFDEEAYDSGFLRWMSIGFVICAVVGFVTLAWYAYQNSVQPISEDEIPMVAADDAPLKEKPEDPGGWQFDHQDKSVYNELAAGKEDGRPVAERLLPAPEEPVQRPPVDEMLSQQFKPEPVDETPAMGEVMLAPKADAPAAIEEEVKPKAEPVAKAPVVEPEPEAKKAVVIEPKPEAKPAAPVAKPTPAKASASATSGQFMVQLGSFRSSTDADAAWSKISKAHSARLSGKAKHVEQADLGAKGIYYRLQVGPYSTEASAKDLCAYLQQQKQGCLVVKVK